MYLLGIKPPPLFFGFFVTVFDHYGGTWRVMSFLRRYTTKTQHMEVVCYK